MNQNETDEKGSKIDFLWSSIYGQGAKETNETSAQENHILKGKILIVDDEEVNIRVIEAYLNNEYDITTAKNGRDAMERICQDKPDIVLLDLMMPIMSGYEVCKIIKENDATRFIPIVIITALSGSEAKIKAIETGADDYLTKPINRIELITRVNALLKKKYYQDQLIHDKETIEMQNKALLKEHDKLEEKIHGLTSELTMKRVSNIKDILKPNFLFSWNDVPGSDNDRLIEFLNQKHCITWVKIAKIEKMDEGRSIRISYAKNSISLSLNNEKTKVNLIIDDGRTNEFIVKIECSRLNVYKS